MRKNLKIELNDTTLAMLDGITFAQVPYWFPFFNTRDLKLNLLLPFGKPDTPRPLIVWVCGGGWVTMDRSAHTPFLLYFAKRGYIVASVEYRRSNSAHFPAQLQDVKSAIRYLRAHAGEFGINPAKVAVMGESAGGYLAAMAGATAGQARFDVGDNLSEPSAVAAVVDYYGPANLTGFGDSLAANAPTGPRPDQMLLGPEALLDPEKARQANVDTFITPKAPPYLLLHGTADPVVPIAQSEFLYEKLGQAGVRAEFLAIEGAGHAAPHFYQDEVNARVLAFLDGILK